MSSNMAGVLVGLEGIPGAPAHLDLSGTDLQIEMALQAEIGAHRSMVLGPFLLGMIFDMMLCGVVWHQFMCYLQYPGKDRWFVRGIVYWVVLVSAATSCYSFYFIYTLFVKGFGYYTPFTQMKYIATYGVLNTFTTMPAQLIRQIFYLERAYRLLKQKIWVPIYIVTLMTSTIATGFGLTFVMRDIGDLTGDITRMKPWFYACDSTILLTDISLTAMLCYGLANSRTGWTHTDRLVTRLIRMSVEAALPATIYALSVLITYSINNLSSINHFWVMQVAKTYVISLLAVLNYRTTLRSEHGSNRSANTMENGPYGTSGVKRRNNGTLGEAFPLDAISVTRSTVQQAHVLALPKKSVNRDGDIEEEVYRDHRNGDLPAIKFRDDRNDDLPDIKVYDLNSPVRQTRFVDDDDKF